MDEDKEPRRPPEDMAHRAGRLAKETEARLPAWLRPANPESRWPVLLALIAAIAMQRAIPQRYTVVPRWPLIAMEVLLLVILLILNPVKLTRSTTAGRTANLVLLAAITIDNTA